MPDTSAARDKIDPGLAAVAASNTRVPVLVLGRHQLLTPPGGLAQFQRTNAGRRLDIRRDVVAGLQAISKRDMSAIESGLPESAQARRLWLLNGILAHLTRTEIETLSFNPAVGYLYLLDRLPPAHASGVATLVTPNRSPFESAGKRIPWNIEKLGAPTAWAAGVTGEGITVALIDEAISIQHPDLQANVWVNGDEIANNGSDDDHNGYIDDRHGYDFSTNAPDNGSPGGPHGTYVAGIIAGDGKGGIVTGVAPRARIMPLVGITFPEVALALQYALENGADIVNMSFSIPDQRQMRAAWRMIADHAVAAGLVLVSGAGNFRQTQPIPVQLRIPEDIPSVIAVGGVNESAVVAPFSSFGPVEWGSVRFYADHPLPLGLTKPDVVAFPGAGYPVLQLGSGYIDPNPTVRGNSFSGPHVAGAAALLLSVAPQTTAWRIAEILEQSASDISPRGKDNMTGSGLIDVAAALALISKGS